MYFDNYFLRAIKKRMTEIQEYAYNLKGSDVKIELNFSEDVF